MGKIAIYDLCLNGVKVEQIKDIIYFCSEN